MSSTDRQPRPRTAGGRARRQAIIDAAADLMYRDGVSATSLDDVLAASGTGKSQLYHYFAGKTDLVRWVVGRQLERVLSNQPRLASIRTWADFVAWSEEVLAIHLSEAGPQACPVGTLAAEIDRDPALRPAAAAAFLDWQAPLTAALATLQEQGAVRTDVDAATLALRTLVVLQGGMLMAATLNDAGVLADALRAHVGSLRASAST